MKRMRKKNTGLLLSGFVLALAGSAAAGDKPINLTLSYEQMQKILSPGYVAPTGVGEVSHAGDRPINEPSWKDDRLMSVEFRDIGVPCAEPYSKPGILDLILPKKKGAKLPDACSRGEGLIRGNHLLELAHPAEQALFEQVMKQRGETGDISKLYQTYLQQITDQATGLLLLNRILDHKVAILSLPVEASDDRVHYVMRSVLVQNAVNKDKIHTKTITVKVPVKGLDGRIKTDKDGNMLTKDVQKKVADENISLRSHQELYGWLQETVGTRAVRFNIDWTYNDGGLGLDLDAVREEGSKLGLTWPAVTMSFAKLPPTWQEFMDQIKQKIDPNALSLARSYAWQFLVQKDNPLLSWQSLFAVTTTELAHMYDAMKESSFKVQDQDASISELVVSGAKGAAFAERYNALLAKRQTDLLNEIFGQNPNGAADDADQAKLKQKILDLRRSVPREIYNQAVTEFGADIIRGDLKVSILPRKVTHKGLDAMPAQGDKSEDAQITQMVFNPAFGSVSLIPKLDLVTTDGSLKSVFLEEVTPGAVSYVNLNDPRVEPILRQKIMAKKQGEAFRNTVFKLLRENRVYVKTSTCSELNWPCASTDARRLTEVLFPETYYPGNVLPSDGPGQPPISSTLGRSEYMDRVFEISTDLFSRVFEIINK